MFNCQEIKDKQIWDSFVTSQPSHTFLHSWNWGQFNAEMGDRVWRLGVYNVDKILVAAALVVKVHARRGDFIFIPHGPITNQALSAGDLKTAFETLLKEITRVSREEKASFIRISPLLEKNQENKKLFKDLGFRPAPIHMHAEITWTLNLALTENELFSKMRKTTRNLIRRAERDGVKIVTGTSDEEFESFQKLYAETSRRHTFTPFSHRYLKTQISAFQKDGSVEIFNACYNNQTIASAIVVFYGKSAYYHHGASTPSKIPAAYLLQWEAIREAKRRGHEFYNFWGVIPENAPKNHPWAGITLFKKGFGGFQTDYIHAQDLPLSWKYWINWGIETIRKRRRNL